MARLWALALVTGFAAAFAVAGFPALAGPGTNHAIDAQGGSTGPFSWAPAMPAPIAVGDSVTWRNSSPQGNHSICVRRSNVPSGCAEFRMPPTGTSASWPAEGYTHTFASDGTFAFMCTLHTSMAGEVKVGTGANPPPPTSTTPTPTNTTPTTTGTTPTTTTDTSTTPTTTTETSTTPGASADTVKPRFVGAISRRAAKLSFRISERARLTTLVERRAPRAKRFKRLSRRTVSLAAGRRTLALAKKLGQGSYRVTLVLSDAAGNRSAPRVLKFKVR